MRIVIACQEFMTSGVGTTKPYDLARHLVGAGHHVTVLCGRTHLAQGMELPSGFVKRLNVDGIDVICLAIESHQGMGFVRRLVSFLAYTVLTAVGVCLLGRYDVLVASSPPLTVGLIGLAARYVRRIPFVFEIRDLWPECPYANGFLRSRTLFEVATVFEEWFYREAGAVCAISRRMIERLVERGFPARKIHFIPTGVAVARFDVGPDAEFRREHDLEGCQVAVYVGAHGRANGLDYLLGAAEPLKGDPAVRIVLIGDGSEKARLVAEARRRGLDGDPLVFCSPVPRRSVPGILKACDVMLMINAVRPGMQILMPNKFFDYLAAGRPMITNIRSELTDWILEADCGVVAECPEELAPALRRFADDPREAAEMGRRGRDLAGAHFDRAALNQQWETVLMRAIAGGVGGTDR